MSPENTLKKYPEPINGFDFIMVKGTPRYRYGAKIIKADIVPEEVKAELLRQYEQLTALRNAENARIEKELKAKEASEKAKEKLDDEPFDTVIESSQMTAEEQAILDSYPTDPNVELTAPDIDVDIAALKQENEKLKEMLNGLLEASVFEADLHILAGQLAERFNIYTVFIGREPQDTDIHPITAEIMNSFDKGLAYKQYVRANLSGVLANLPKTIAGAQTMTRYEVQQESQVADLPPQYRKMENPDTYYQQSHLNKEVKKSDFIDGVIQDPPVNAMGVARTIVDPGWLKNAKTIDQFDLEDI